MKEYRVEISKGSVTTGRFKNKLEEQLNKIAAEGWALFSREGAVQVWVREK